MSWALLSMDAPGTSPLELHLQTISCCISLPVLVFSTRRMRKCKPTRCEAVLAHCDRCDEFVRTAVWVWVQRVVKKWMDEWME